MTDEQRKFRKGDRVEWEYDVIAPDHVKFMRATVLGRTYDALHERTEDMYAILVDGCEASDIVPGSQLRLTAEDKKSPAAAKLGIIDEPSKQKSRKAPFWMEWYLNAVHLLYLFFLSEYSLNPFTQEEGRDLRRLLLLWLTIFMLGVWAGWTLAHLQ